MTQPREGIVGVGGDSRARRDASKLKRSKYDDDEVDDSEVEVDEVGKKVQKTSKSKNSSKSKKIVGSADFLTPGAKLAFTKLRQTFLKASILHHFDLPCHPHWLGGFSLIDLLSGFSPQFSTGLEGSSSATWLFEAYQLLYGTRIFSMVSRFSSPVFLIELGGFSPGSHFSSTISRSTKLVFEERGNCNNVTLGTKSSQRGGYMITIIQNFILVSSTSTIIPHPDWLSFGALYPLLDLCTWPLLTLCTRPLTAYVTDLAGYLCKMFRSGIICRLSTCRGIRLDHLWMSFNGKEQLVGWTQSDLFSWAVVSLVISISQGVLTRWRRSDTSKARLDGTGL